MSQFTSSSTSNALTVQPAGTSSTVTYSKFHKKRKVLEEEDYINRLEEIIERDYFPHLSKMKEQLSYLQRSEMFDISTLRRTYKQLFQSSFATTTNDSKDSYGDSSGKKNPHHHNISPLSSSQHSLVSSRAGETEIDRDDNNNKQEKKKKMTVTEFFTKYTSEDNESFEELHEKSLQERRRKFHWMHEALDNHLMLTNGPSSGNGGSGGVDHDQRRAGMLMLYYVGNKVLTNEERRRLDAILAGEVSIGDDRKNGVDTWAFRVRNQFMFYPELKDSIDTCWQPANPQLAAIDNGSSSRTSALPQQSNPSNQSQLMIQDSSDITQKKGSDELFLVPTKPSSKQPRYQNNRALSNPLHEKRIQKESTNLPGMDLVQAVDAYLRGQTTHFAATPLEAPHTPSTIATQHSINSSDASWSASTITESATKRGSNNKKDYDVVSMSPAPVPGQGLLASPLMTWGEIAATPLVLNRQEKVPSSLTGLVNSGGPKFHLNPTSEREKLARSLEAQMKHRTSSKSTPLVPQTNDRASILNTPIFGGPTSKKSISSSTPSASSKATPAFKKLEHLTPAAQALAAKLQKNMLIPNKK